MVDIYENGPVTFIRKHISLLRLYDQMYLSETCQGKLTSNYEKNLKMRSDEQYL